MEKTSKSEFKNNNIYKSQKSLECLIFDMMDIVIGGTYYDGRMNQIHVVDIAENFNSKSGESSKVILYKRNKSKKILQSFHDVLVSTLVERK